MANFDSTSIADRSLLPRVLDQSENYSPLQKEGYTKNGAIRGRFPNNEVAVGEPNDSDLKKLFQTPVSSPEEIARAGKKLDDSISSFAPKEMQQDLKNIHAGVLGGDTAKVAEAIKDIQTKHPDMLKDAVKEINREFKENNAGVEMAVSGDGKVLLYKNNPFDMSGNKSALQIDPKDGSVGARPIKVRDDSTVVLEPGEIVNADVAKIAKSMGDAATSNINSERNAARTPEELPVTMGIDPRAVLLQHGIKPQEFGKERVETAPYSRMVDPPPLPYEVLHLLHPEKYPEPRPAINLRELLGRK